MSSKSKLIVITGGTKGIGESIIRLFAKKGFDIATCSRNAEDLLRLKNEIQGEFNTNAYVFTADLSIRGEVNDFISFVNKLKQPVDVLVNNAGRFVPGEIHKENDGILEELIETNLYSAYHLTRGLIADIKKRRKGHIFNICSVASLAAYPNGGSYSISKFALYGFSKVLREEMKEHGVKVTSILPGATKTDSWKGVDLPDNRFIQPNDVAVAIWSAYKLSPGALIEDMIIRPQLGDI